MVDAFERVPLANGAKQKRVGQIAALIPEGVFVAVTWRVKLKVVAFDRAGAFPVIPFLAHCPERLIATGADTPNTAAGMAFSIVVPEHEEDVRSGVEGRDIGRLLGRGAFPTGRNR